MRPFEVQTLWSLGSMVLSRLNMIFQFLLLLLARVAFAAWGYTETSDSYIIDTGKGLVVTVSTENGDITSLLYNDVEYNGYDGKNTQVESGLGASDVSIVQYSDPYVIKVCMFPNPGTRLRPDRLILTKRHRSLSYMAH